MDESCVEANEDGCLNCEEGYFLYSKQCYFINLEEIVQNVLQWTEEMNWYDLAEIDFSLIFSFSLNWLGNWLLLMVDK